MSIFDKSKDKRKKLRPKPQFYTRIDGIQVKIFSFVWSFTYQHTTRGSFLRKLFTSLQSLTMVSIFLLDIMAAFLRFTEFANQTQPVKERSRAP